ncbi:MAG: immunoglobulin-like domain-containing protein [Bacteroidota bacterium]
MKLFLKFARLTPVFVLTVFFLGCGDDDDDNLPQVVAGFTQTIDQGIRTVTFINTSENTSKYVWDFGDSTTSTDINPIKTYESGEYTVTLTASNTSGGTATFEDTFTILAEPSLPLTFDNEGIFYTADVFNGASYEVVANPDESGSNAKSGNVGAITNSGAFFEGIAFTLSTSIDLTEDKTIQMNFWSNTAVDVLLKLEITETNAIETTASHGGSGWEMISFDFASSASYPKLVIFVDGPGTTTGTFYVDDIMQVETPDTTPPVITLNGDATIEINIGEMFTDPGAMALDNIDGDISNSIVIAGDVVDTSVEGEYVITYNVSDASGNAADEVTRTVNVITPNPFCNTQIQAFAGDAGSDIFISVFNVDDLTMRIEIESADDDPVDLLVFPAGLWNPIPGLPSGPPTDQGDGVWGGDFFFPGGAPETVEFFIEWSKVSFPGNWRSTDPDGELDEVQFDATCETAGGGGGGTGCSGSPVAATTFPVDFESCESFISSFASMPDGVVASLDVNPSKSGINMSDNVLKVVRASGINRWGGVQNSFPAGTIDITTNVFKIKVYSSVPDVTYRFELALDPQTDPATGNPPPVFRQVSGGANTWTELEFTFTGLPATPTTYNQLVIKPDNPDGSDGETTTEERTFYFDDLRLENP